MIRLKPKNWKRSLNLNCEMVKSRSLINLLKIHLLLDYSSKGKKERKCGLQENLDLGLDQDLYHRSRLWDM